MVEWPFNKRKTQTRLLATLNRMSFEAKQRIKELSAMQNTGGSVVEDIELRISLQRRELEQLAEKRKELAEKLGMSIKEAEKIIELKK